jgi:hypothetical protein
LAGIAQAQEAERFTLIDGRVVVGIYDPVTRSMRTQTESGLLIFPLEPEAIASRAPQASSVVEAALLAPPETSSSPQPREYYLREKRRLDDQLRDDRRVLYQELGLGLYADSYPLMREQLFDISRAYEMTDLAFRVTQDAESKRALGEQRLALEQQRSALLLQMKQIEGERSIVRERLEYVERHYREQLVLLERAWARDGHGRSPIQ